MKVIVLNLYCSITLLFSQTWWLKTIAILLHFLILWADRVQLSSSFASHKILWCYNYLGAQLGQSIEDGILKE